jgi:mannose-6-phosphate isomerase-like protein (cupin superfamily)
MFIRSLDSCKEFIAGNNSVLRELFNPLKERLDLRYSLAHATVSAGDTTTPHSLRTSEVYYILSGSGIMHIDTEQHSLGEGDAVYIPPDAVQYIHNPGPEELVFLCIVDPAWRPEDETIKRP